MTQATLTKKNVRIMLNISASTLNRWLNIRYFEELQQIGYQKNDRILNPKIVNYLRSKIDL